MSFKLSTNVMQKLLFSDSVLFVKNAFKFGSSQTLKPRFLHVGGPQKAIFAKDQLAGFRAKDIKKHYSLMPLVGIVIFASTVAIVFPAYFWYTRPEITMFRTEGAKLLQDTMDLNDPPHLKILKVVDEDRKLPEVKALLKDIEEAEKKMK